MIVNRLRSARKSLISQELLPGGPRAAQSRPHRARLLRHRKRSWHSTRRALGRSSSPAKAGREHDERAKSGEQGFQSKQSGCAAPVPPAARASGEHVRGGRDEHAGTARFTPHALVRRAGLRAVVIAGIQLPLVDPQLAFEQVQFLHPRMVCGGYSPPGSSRTSMVTRPPALSAASSFTVMPGAGCSHSGSDQADSGGNTGSPPVSCAIRCASRPQSGCVGRSTSVGQITKESITG